MITLFYKSSIGTPNALAILATVCTLGLTTTLYVEGKGISPEQYQAKKARLLGEKADIEQEIRDFEQKGNNWLEPMREVILLSSQAKILLSQGDKTQIRAFLKNVGLNFMLNSKWLDFSPKNGWGARIAGKPMTSFPTGGEGGIRTLGGPKDHNGFRDRPIRPLWHLSAGDYNQGKLCFPQLREPVPSEPLGGDEGKQSSN